MKSIVITPAADLSDEALESFRLLILALLMSKGFKPGEFETRVTKTR